MSGYVKLLPANRGLECSAGSAKRNSSRVFGAWQRRPLLCLPQLNRPEVPLRGDVEDSIGSAGRGCNAEIEADPVEFMASDLNSGKPPSNSVPWTPQEDKRPLHSFTLNCQAARSSGA